MGSTLTQQVVVVTGAGGGLGQALASRCAAEGAQVLAVSRRRPAVDGLVATVRAAGGVAVACAADVTAAGAAEAVAAAALAAFGRWDMLVNAAGVFVSGDVLGLDDADWDAAVATHMTAPFRLSRALLRHLAGRGAPGAILNIGSLHGAVADGEAVPQCASKAGLHGLTRSLAEACRGRNVRVNAIAPGMIAAASAARHAATVDDPVTQGDVAQLAVWLLSPQACAISGCVIDAFGPTRPGLVR